MRTLHGLVERAARSTPDAAAVIGNDETLSYAALWARAGLVARALCRIGVRSGDRVGLHEPKSASGVAQIIGILRAGAAYVPIDPAAPPARVAFVSAHCKLACVLASQRQLRQLQKAGLGNVLDAETFTGAAGDEVPRTAEPPAQPVIERDLAYVLYTSGSTGQPKGVAISHGQSLAFVESAVQVFGLGASDVLASHAPFNFDLSIIDLFCTFAAGASVVLLPERWLAFPSKLAAMLETHRVTVWNSVPSALIQLVERGGLESKDLAALRLILFAGEPYPVPKLRALAAAVPGAKLVNVYGQTEANSSTYHVVGDLTGSPASVPIGKPLPGYRILLLDDEDAAITAPDIEGEIVVRGAAVASGYFDDPERTAAAFVANPTASGVADIVYRTGDRGAFDGDGALHYRGRRDRAVKVRGFRVELAEIEHVARSLNGVTDAAVVSAPDEETGHRLHLAWVGDAAEAEVVAHLAAQLPRYMLPSSLRQLDALPLGPTGKLDTAALALLAGA